ncbi:MAG: hypothetical protein Q4G68_09600 [Planctomycetia bacterium]|nr:hypothetical protein [Planctomycetia bacterium]
MQDPKKFIELLKSDPRFTVESYRFVNDALEYANRCQQEEAEAEDEDVPSIIRALSGGKMPAEQHVSGRDLCYAARDFALEQYGLLAKHVLARLGIYRTGDIGEIVYNLIGIGYMQQNLNDTRADFDDVFDLGKDLDRGFVFIDELKEK